MVFSQEKIARTGKRMILVVTFLAIAIYAGIPRMMSVPNGLPYHHFWDEPVTATGALVAMKTNNFFPHGQDLVYGGAVRNPLILVDYIYYIYLRLSPEYDVERKYDIKTHLEGVYKTTSHSGFYYWSRSFVVLLNLLGFLFAFEIGRLRGGYVQGLIAVILLASVFMYYERSFLVNVDTPLSTWILGTILFSLRFNRDRKNSDLLLSFICVGLAGGTKYTGALSFIIPLTAALLNRDHFQWTNRKDIARSVLKWAGISFGVFAILNPVIIVFPDRMFKVILYISRVYRNSEGHFSKEPGLEHLTYQITELIQNLGPVFFWIAMVGCLVGFLRMAHRQSWTSGWNAGFIILTIFPFFYLFYVTSFYAVAYHRNFTLMYPILCILAADASVTLIGFVSRFSRWESGLRVGLSLLVLVTFFYYSLPGYSKILKSGRAIQTQVETRTQAVLAMNDLSQQDPNIILGIPDDLLMSPVDLRKLQVPYGFYTISDIDSALYGYTHLLLPDYEQNYAVENFDSLKTRMDNYVNQRELLRTGGHKLTVQPTLSDHEWPIYNPSVIIIKGADFPPPKGKKYAPKLFTRTAATIISNRGEQLFFETFSPGNYILQFDSKGDSAAGEFPIVKLVIDFDTVATVVTMNTYVTNSIEFSVPETRRVNITMNMINDYYDPETHMDRNVYLKRLVIKKKEND